MAKKSMIAREHKRIKIVARYAEKRAALKAIMNDQNASSEERYEASIKFQKLPRNSSPSRVVRRCQVTGRPHAVYRKFALCISQCRNKNKKWFRFIYCLYQ